MVRLIGRGRDERGQAVVELALVMPILMLLLVGMFEFARAWQTYQVLTDAAREGARTGVLANPLVTADSVRKVIRNAASLAALDTSMLSITLTGVDAPSGTPLTVQLQYPFRFSVLGGSSGVAVTLASTVVMRNE